MALSLRQSYIANIAGADLALRVRSAKEAQRRLFQAPSSLRAWEWQHLSLAADSSLARFETDTDPVLSVSFDATGREIIWNTKNRVHLVDLASNRRVSRQVSG